MLAFDASGHCEGPMALDQFLRFDSRAGLEIVDILRVLREKLVFALQELDESMRRREALRGWEDVLCDGIKDPFRNN